MSDYIVEAAKNSGHVAQNTLASFGVPNATASGNIVGAGAQQYAELKGLTEEVDALGVGKSLKVVIKLVPYGGGAAIDMAIDLSKDPNSDGYRAFYTGGASALVGISIAELMSLAIGTFAGTFMLFMNISLFKLHKVHMKL